MRENRLAVFIGRELSRKLRSYISYIRDSNFDPSLERVEQSILR